MSVSIIFASGKGGVGKSTLTANIGAALARSGHSVIIVDADIGLRSQDTLLGVENSVVYDMVDVIHKECTLDQAILNCPAVSGLSLLPASQFARVSSMDGDQMRKLIKKLKLSFEYILVDSPAGIERGFRNVVNAGCDEIILVVTPDDICLRDAERAAQIIEAKHLQKPRILVNRLDHELIHRQEMMSAKVISDVLDLSLLGEVPEDPVVYRSILKHVLFLDYQCEAREAMIRVAGRLAGQQIPFPAIGSNPLPLFRRLFNRRLKEVASIDIH